MFSIDNYNLCLTRVVQRGSLYGKSTLWHLYTQIVRASAHNAAAIEMHILHIYIYTYMCMHLIAIFMLIQLQHGSFELIV